MVSEPIERSTELPSNTISTASDKGLNDHADMSANNKGSPSVVWDDSSPSPGRESQDMEESEDESDRGQIISVSGTPAEMSSAAYRVSGTPEDAENFYSPDVIAEASAEDFGDAQIEGTEHGHGDMVMEDSPQDEIVSPQLQADGNEQPVGTPLEEGEVRISESPGAGDNHGSEELISQTAPEHYEQPVPTAADLASEHLPTEELATQASNSALVSHGIPQSDTSGSNPKESSWDGIVVPPFQPYESILRIFKSYRNHPEYKANVSGGYRSMTFSHNIDANKEICPYETAGGVCNDNSCNFQHFRDMELSGAL